MGILLLMSATMALVAMLGPGVAEGADGDAVQGRWIAVSAERNGRAAGDLKGHELTFAGDRFTIRSKGKLLYEGTYALGSSQTPPTIDFTQTAGQAKGQTWLGIYRLADDALSICDNADDVGRGRPSGFATAPGSGQVLLNFRREKR